jgi:hypothetical protein
MIKRKRSPSEKPKVEKEKNKMIKNIFKINKNKNEIRLTKLIFRIDICYIM